MTDLRTAIPGTETAFSPYVMDLLFSLLQGTLNPSNEVRREAEKRLGEVRYALQAPQLESHITSDIRADLDYARLLENPD